MTYSHLDHKWTFGLVYPRPLFPAVLTLLYQDFIKAQRHRQVKADRNSSQHRVTVNKISPLSFTPPSQFRSNLLHSTHAAESTEFARCLSLLSSLLLAQFTATHTQPHQNIELRCRHASQTTLRARHTHTHMRKHTLPHFIRWPQRCEGQPKEREIEKSIQIYTGIPLGKEVWNIK